MSLDVYLEAEEPLPSPAKIMIREGGCNREISADEWNRRFPDREPVTVAECETTTLYHANITHNLGTMAAMAGLYEYLWKPETLSITKASQLIEPLFRGWKWLLLNPDRAREANPKNGWGNYELLCSFVRDYLEACLKTPEAKVRVWG